MNQKQTAGCQKMTIKSIDKLSISLCSQHKLPYSS